MSVHSSCSHEESPERRTITSEPRKIPPRGPIVLLRFATRGQMHTIHTRKNTHTPAKGLFRVSNQAHLLVCGCGEDANHSAAPVFPIIYNL